MITTSDIYANSALVFSGSYPITGFALDLQNAMIYAYSDGYTVPEALEQAAKDFMDRNVSRSGKIMRNRSRAVGTARRMKKLPRPVPFG